MLVVHTTLLRNLKSIREFGILASYSTQKRAATWFHTQDVNDWGETHVRLRKGGTGKGIVHIYVNVPKSRLKKHGKGLYYVMGDVPPCDIVKVCLVQTVLKEI
jgi:hypothetical protein